MVKGCGPLARALRAAIAIAAIAAAGMFSYAHPRAQSAAAPDLQAAFLLNFARFTEWPPAPNRRQLVICVYGDDRLGDAVVRALRGQTIGGRALVLSRIGADSAVVHCQVLFVAGAAITSGRPLLERASRLPVLTVSDQVGFAAQSGIVELFVEDGRMRFAVNVDAAERARLNLSSRLLGLAKIVRGTHDF